MLIKTDTPLAKGEGKWRPIVKAARAQESAGAQAATLAQGDCSSLGLQPPTRLRCPRVAEAVKSRTILPCSAQGSQGGGESPPSRPPSVCIRPQSSLSTLAHGLPGGHGDLTQASRWDRSSFSPSTLFSTTLKTPLPSLPATNSSAFYLPPRSKKVSFSSLLSHTPPEPPARMRPTNTLTQHTPAGSLLLEPHAQC